jgi:Ca2+-binding EF-hand superfamily protein
MAELYDEREQEVFTAVRAEGDTFSKRITEGDVSRQATHKLAIAERAEGEASLTDDLETKELLAIIRDKVQLRSRIDGDMGRKLANDMRKILGSKASAKMVHTAECRYPDFSMMISRMFDMALTQPQLKKLFHLLDVDGDEVLQIDELVAGLTGQKEEKLKGENFFKATFENDQARRKEAKAAFDPMERKDTSVSRELAGKSPEEILEQISEVIRARCRSHADMLSHTTNLLRKSDTNKAGKINRDGFVTTVARLFGFNLTDKQGHGLFNLLDTTGEGELDRVTIVNGLLGRFNVKSVKAATGWTAARVLQHINAAVDARMTQSGTQSSDYINTLLRKFDLDGSGQIDLREFVDTTRTALFGLKLDMQQSEDLFKLIDTDNDGTVDTAELIVALCGRKTREKAKQVVFQGVVLNSSHAEPVPKVAIAPQGKTQAAAAAAAAAAAQVTVHGDARLPPCMQPHRRQLDQWGRISSPVAATRKREVARSTRRHGNQESVTEIRRRAARAEGVRQRAGIYGGHNGHNELMDSLQVGAVTMGGGSSGGRGGMERNRQQDNRHESRQQYVDQYDKHYEEDYDEQYEEYCDTDPASAQAILNQLRSQKGAREKTAMEMERKQRSLQRQQRLQKGRQQARRPNQPAQSNASPKNNRYRYYRGVLIPTGDNYKARDSEDGSEKAYEEKKAEAKAEAQSKLYVHGNVVDMGMLMYELMDMEDELCA